MPQSDVPGEKTSPTQPFPTKPAPFDRQGVTVDDLIDFTPELKAEAIKIARAVSSTARCSRRRSCAIRTARSASLILPHHTGGANWPGGAVDPETGIMYVSSVTNPDILAVAAADPKRSDMGYVGGRCGAAGGAGRGQRTRAGGDAGGSGRRRCRARRTSGRRACR